MKGIIIITVISTLFTYILKGQQPINPSFKYYSNPGIVNIFELTGATGLGSTEGINEKYFYGINNTIGYQIDRNFLGGIGLGYLSYDNDQYIPLYLDFRYSLYLKVITPYLFSDGGLLIEPTNLISNTKMFLNPGIGINRSLNSKSEIFFASGLFVNMGDMKPRASFINFKFGIIFRKNHFRLYKARNKTKYF
jgi:hypothetical protein